MLSAGIFQLVSGQTDTFLIYTHLFLLCKTSGNFEPEERQPKQAARQVGRQETGRSILSELTNSQFDSIEFDDADEQGDFYPVPPMSAECSSLQSILPPSESAVSSLGTSLSLETA